MRKYIVYDDAGNILKFGCCPTADVGLQVNTKVGGAVTKHVKVVPMLSNVFDIENEVKDGEVVKKEAKS